MLPDGAMESAKEGAMDLTEEQWSILEPLIPKPRVRSDGRGRPWCDDRQVLNGILGLLRAGAQWRDVPERYPSPATCHRRHQRWVRGGVFERILTALAQDLRDRGKLDLSECMIDGSFAIAKKGGSVLGPLSGARAARSWQWQSALVFLSPSTWPALRRMRSSSSSRPSMPGSSPRRRSGSSATRRTIAIRSRRTSPRRASS